MPSCPRTIFYCIANVACSYCMVQIKVRGPARTVWRRRRRCCKKGTSHHTTMSSHYANRCTRNPSKCWQFAWFRPETDRETDRKTFGFGFVIFRLHLKNQPKQTYFLMRNRKTDRAFISFRFTTLMTPQTQAGGLDRLRIEHYWAASMLATPSIFGPGFLRVSQIRIFW